MNDKVRILVLMAVVAAMGGGDNTLKGEQKMHGRVGKMTAVEGKRDELIAILLADTKEMPGCLSYVVAKDPADATSIWITEVWDSKASHEASLSLPAVREAITRGKPMIAKFDQSVVTEPVGGHLAAMNASASVQQRGSYASVNGLKVYYEIHGGADRKSAPLVLLHGGVGGIEMFGPNLPALAKNRRVIAVNLQAHGRTADIDRPLRFELMAADIAALLKHLEISQADVMGYSLGGGVALQTAIKYPHIVRKLVVVSTPCKRNAFYPEVLAAMDQMGPAAAAGMKNSPLANLYPDADWSTLFAKLGDLLKQDYDWSKDAAEIKAPTMIVFADADAVGSTHIMEFFALLGGGQRDAGLDGSGRPVARLAIVPGVTHYDILRSATVAELVVPFLDSQAPSPR